MVLGAALVASSCSSSDGVVATVNGVDIRESEVLSLREQGSTRVNAADFRNDLSTVIFQKVLITNLESNFGITVTQDQIDQRLQEQLQLFNQTIDDAVAALQEPGATERMLLFNQSMELLVEAGEDAVASTDDAVRRLLDEDSDLITTVCVRHVLVETSPEADEVFRKITEGEDLSDVSDDVSLDTGTPGGDLGCSPVARYVAEFAAATLAAPIGVPFGPVETQFGFHVMIVDERTAPTFEDLMADIRTYVPPDVLRSGMIAWFNERVGDSDISVISRIGTWVPEGPGIEPPE